MKSAAAWSVKGVGIDARETAYEAARRAGLSVGEWLNSVIIDSAGDADHGRYPDEADGAGFSAIHQHLDALAARLGKMGAAPPARPRHSDVGSDLAGLEARLSGISKDLARCGEETPQRVADAIKKLNERLDHLIVSGRTAAGEFERRVAAVDNALDELNGETRRAAFSPSRRTGTTGAAVNEIKSRQRTIDADRPAADIDDEVRRPFDIPGPLTSELDRNLRALSRQLETMARPCGFDNSIAALRNDLARIGDALAKAMPRCALDALESEIESLAHRAGRDRHRGADAAALAGIEQRLGEIQEALAELTPAESIGGFEAAVQTLSRKIDVLAANGPDAPALHHLETAVGELRRITERVASGEALATLAGEVRALAERMDLFAAPGGRNALASLERRIESLNELVKARAAEPAVPSRLENLIGALSAQLQRLDVGDGNRAALGNIEGQIARLAEKVDVSAARLGQVQIIERGLADLFLQIEDIRANVVEAAGFKRDLADLRLTQAEADRRTQAMLAAVQDTIDRLAHRLDRIESDSRAEPQPHPPQPPLQAAMMPALARVPTVAPAEAISPAAPLRAGGALQAEAPPQAGAPTASHPLAPVRPAIDPSLPADHPLEPGSRRAATAAERIAASETGLAPRKSNGASETSEKADFIAAAWRAAQAAAAEAVQAGGKQADDKSTALEAGEGERSATFKRQLFLSVAAATLVIGATHVTLSMLGSSGSAPIEAPAQTPNSASGREATKADTPASSAAPTAEPQAPVPGPQLFAPTSVANSSLVVPPGASSVAPRPGSTNSHASEVTGSIAKPEDSAGAPAASPTAAPAPASADSLPAAIGGPGLRSAAAAGNAAAEYEIAIRYAEGRGVAQSFGDAARWFERAASKGLVPAQYRLGSLYEKGHGVKKDLEAARRLYVSAAEKGNARAMHNLAVLYAEGIDGKPEYKTAFQWFRKAASHGIADSQYNLGILLARGIGAEQNLAESYKWFALAAQQGDHDAGRKRDDVAARLDSQSLVAAKLAAQTFTVESQPEEATTVKDPGGGWDQPAAAATPAPAPAKQKAAPRGI
jgi:localization factor PodJL